MNAAVAAEAPRRVSDLANARKSGADVTVQMTFDILPVDFEQREHPFRAYIFLCRYAGVIAGRSYEFRKCYARGCPNNLCPHVFQAVMIANRHLRRDYETLKAGGIMVAEREFSLDEMMVKFNVAKEEVGPLLTIYDYIRIAGEGNTVRVDVTLECLPAVEHFANYKNAQTFLIGDFAVQALAKTGSYQRCLSCYPTDHEKEEKPQAIRIANQRLTLLYRQFDQVSIQHHKEFFE